MQRMDKFQHIEGLRGLAILFVILFHAFPAQFAKGYLGVDVFLVISGYLLLRKPFPLWQEGVFSGCWSFAKKKIVRLMPLLLATVILTLIAGCCILTPEDMSATAKTALYALTGTSNIYLDSLSSDYFAEDTAYNALVHTWYLSVLIQVYILYMVGGLLLRKASKPVLIPILVVLAACSYLFSDGAITLFNKITGTNLATFGLGYYSTGARLWEILAGGAVALLPQIPLKWGRTAIGLVATVCLITLLFLPTGAGRSIAPLFAVAGAVCCIAYAKDGAAGAILNSAPLRWVGTISFSLYLVHMPVLVFLRCVPQTEAWLAIAGGAMLICSLGYLFFKLVEQKKFSVPSTLTAWGCSLPLLAAVLVWNPAVLFWSVPTPLYAAYADLETIDEGDLYEGYDRGVMVPTDNLSKIAKAGRLSCFYHMGVEAGPMRILLIGDSHAGALFSGLDTFCKTEGLSGCTASVYIMPFHGMDMPGANKSQHWTPGKEEAFFSWLERHPELANIIIAQRWRPRLSGNRQSAGRIKALRQFILRIRGMGRNVILVAPTPEIAASSTVRSYRLKEERSRQDQGEALACTEAAYHAEMSGVLDMLGGYEKEGICHVLHIERSLFPGGVFSSIQDGGWLMYDDNHLSPAGSIKAIMGCKEELKRMLRR